MAAHRYWRLLITANCAEGTDGLTSVMELGLRTSIGGASVATGGTPSASSVGFGWTPDGAFNGTTSGNGWHSGTGALPATSEWVKYDFGAGNEKDIIEFRLDVRNAFPKQWPRDFELQYSDDDSAWTTLIRVGGETDWAPSLAKTYSANSVPNDAGVSQRFWRLRATAVDGGGVLGLSEIRMYASGPTNEALGRPVFSSGVQEGSDVDLVDGVLGTNALVSYWTGWVAAGWVGCKLASAKTITTIGIGARGGSFPNQAPKDFVLEYWDGSAYQTAFTITGATGWTAAQVRYFTSSGEVGGPPGGSAARPVVFICT